MEKAELCSSSETLSSATAASSSRTAEQKKAGPQAGPVDNEDGGVLCSAA